MFFCALLVIFCCVSVIKSETCYGKDKKSIISGIRSSLKTLEDRLNVVKQDHWIGAADHFKEGDWRWMSDLSKVQYSGWHPKEPNNNNGNEDCALISVVYSLPWNDGTCSSSLGFICENQLRPNCLAYARV